MRQRPLQNVPAQATMSREGHNGNNVNVLLSTIIKGIIKHTMYQNAHRPATM